MIDYVRRPAISYGWVVLAAGFAIMLLGYAMRNTFSVFYPVIVFDFGWTRGGTALMYSLTLLSYGMFAPIAGRLADRFHPRYVLATGGLLVGGGIALCSLANSVWFFYFFYGIVVAIGLSLIGITPLISVLSHWFGSRRGGMLFGLLGAGFGVSLVSAPLFQWLISEYGWRMSYLQIGLAAIVLIVPLSLFLMRRSPQQQSLLDQQHQDRGHRIHAENGQTAATLDKHQWTVRDALSTRAFKLFLVAGFCNMGFSQQVVIAHQVYLLQDVGYDPMTAASMFSVFGVAFAIGNVSGLLSDRFGRVPFFVAGSLSIALSIMLLNVAPDPTSTMIPIVFASGTGWGLGVTPPAMFAAVADRFHGRNYGAIHGTLILAISVGGAIGPWLGGVLHDITGNYNTAFLIVQAVLVTGIVMVLLATRSSAMPKIHLHGD